MSASTPTSSPEHVGARYLDSLEAEARRILPEAVHRYLSQGARDGVSTSEAERAWDRFRFLPRVLRDVTRIQPGATVLGHPMTGPFGVAPTTLQRAVRADGELAMADAVRDSGSLLVVSSNAGSPFAELGATGVSWWLQVYLTSDRTLSVPVVERAVAAGATAVVLTVDTPVVGTKYDGGRPVWHSVDADLVRVNFDADRDDPGMEKARDLGPHDVAWLADSFGVPVVVKGVLHPLDARRCVDAGAAAIWVSNHGGRQLDRTVSTADALEGVAREVGTDVEVYVDGGIRHGAHAVIARALGATAVFLGRPPLLGLAVEGAAGVSHVLEELRGEVEEVLTLLGVPSYAELSRELVVAPAS